MNDLISRQAAIEAVSRGCQEFRGIFAECEKNLNELPTANPSTILMKVEGGVDKESMRKAMEEAELTLVAEPRKGKWIDGNEGKWNTAYCPKCSVCGTPFYGIEPVRYHYCPNCGARMEETDVV